MSTPDLVLESLGIPCHRHEVRIQLANIELVHSLVWWQDLRWRRERLRHVARGRLLHAADRTTCDTSHCAGRVQTKVQPRTDPVMLQTGCGHATKVDRKVLLSTRKPRPHLRVIPTAWILLRSCIVCFTNTAQR